MKRAAIAAHLHDDCNAKVPKVSDGCRLSIEKQVLKATMTGATSDAFVSMLERLSTDDTCDTSLLSHNTSLLLLTRAEALVDNGTLDAECSHLKSCLEKRCTAEAICAQLFAHAEQVTLYRNRSCEHLEWIEYLVYMVTPNKISHQETSMALVACLVSLVSAMLLNCDEKTLIRNRPVRDVVKSLVHLVDICVRKLGPSHVTQLALHLAGSDGGNFHACMAAWWPSPTGTTLVMCPQFRSALFCAIDPSCFADVRRLLKLLVYGADSVGKLPAEYITFVRTQTLLWTPRVDDTRQQQKQLQMSQLFNAELQAEFYSPLERFLTQVEQTVDVHKTDDDVCGDDIGDEEDQPICTPQETQIRLFKDVTTLLDGAHWLDRVNRSLDGQLHAPLANDLCHIRMEQLNERLAVVVARFNLSWKSVHAWDRISPSHTASPMERPLPDSLVLAVHIWTCVVYRWAVAVGDSEWRCRVEQLLLENVDVVRNVLLYNECAAFMKMTGFLTCDITEHRDMQNFVRGDSSFVQKLLGSDGLRRCIVGDRNHSANWVYNPPVDGTADRRVCILVRRAHVLDDTRAVLAAMTRHKFRVTFVTRNYRVAFQNENAIGLGPVYEWLHLLAHALFSPAAKTWIFHTEQCAWIPHPDTRTTAAAFASEWIRLAESPDSSGDRQVHGPNDLLWMSGFVIGMFVLFRIRFPYRISEGAALQLLTCVDTLEDTELSIKLAWIARIDPALYQQMTRTLEASPSQLASYGLETDKGEVVTCTNREEYVDHFLNIQAFGADFGNRLLSGFGSVVSEVYDLDLLRVHEIVDYICGSTRDSTDALSLKAWRQLIVVSPSEPLPDKAFRWFWVAFGCLNDSSRRDLLELVTCSRIVQTHPSGASNVSAPRSAFRLCYNAGASPDRFPTVRTCFGDLVLPPFSSQESCIKRITELAQIQAQSKQDPNGGLEFSFS